MENSSVNRVGFYLYSKNNRVGFNYLYNFN